MNFIILGLFCIIPFSAAWLFLGKYIVRADKIMFARQEEWNGKEPTVLFRIDDNSEKGIEFTVNKKDAKSFFDYATPVRKRPKPSDGGETPRI